MFIPNRFVAAFHEKHSDFTFQKKIREVVFHEVGHYFGLTEEELRDIENNGAF